MAGTQLNPVTVIFVAAAFVTPALSTLAATQEAINDIIDGIQTDGDLSPILFAPAKILDGLLNGGYGEIINIPIDPPIGDPFTISVIPGGLLNQLDFNFPDVSLPGTFSTLLALRDFIAVDALGAVQADDATTLSEQRVSEFVPNAAANPLTPSAFTANLNVFESSLPQLPKVTDPIPKGTERVTDLVNKDTERVTDLVNKGTANIIRPSLKVRPGETFSDAVDNARTALTSAGDKVQTRVQISVQKFGDSVEKPVERVVSRVTSLGGASGDDGGDKPKAAADDVR